MSKDAKAGGVSAPPATAGEQLLKLLGGVTAEDLAAFDETLAAREAELAGLREVRRVMAGRLGLLPKKGGPRKGGGKSAAAPPSALDRAEQMIERRRRVAKLLATRAPLFQGAIMSECEIGGRVIAETLACDWFESTSQGFRLTNAGRREALGG